MAAIGPVHFFRYAFQRAFQAHSRFAAHDQQIDGVRRASPNGGGETPLEPRQDPSRPHDSDHPANGAKISKSVGGLPKNSPMNTAMIGNRDHADNFDADPDRHGSMRIEARRLNDRSELLQIFRGVEAAIPRAER